MQPPDPRDDRRSGRRGPGDDGSGIQIGHAAGGALGKMDRVTAWRFIDPPDAWWGGILVGRSGERICNETLYGGKVGEHLIEHHGGKGTLIMDAAMMARGRKQVMTGNPQLYQRAFGLINGYITCRSAPTLQKLVKRFGIDGDRLEATVAAYNAGVTIGVDALGKHGDYLGPISEGPFYGIPFDHDTLLYPTPHLTLGGLRTDGASGRVLRDDGTPIEGLYAAGRTAIGVSSNGYVSGLSVADSIFSGRTAGRHAANRPAAPGRWPPLPLTPNSKRATMDPRSTFALPLRSPALVGAKDRSAWVGLFHADGFVEDPVEAGRYRGTPAIETFWDVFIGPQPSVAFVVKRDFMEYAP